MGRNFFLSTLLGVAISFVAVPPARTAVPEQQRTSQPIVVNGQHAEGITVIENGVLQTFTCSAPQPYTADDSSSGWACYEPSTGRWLLNAQPRQTTEVYNQPAPSYTAPAPVYNYYVQPYPYTYPYSYSYSYPYGYYPYGYYGGPAFAFGFGFGHGYYGHYGHGFYGHGYQGRGFYGQGGHAPFAHGGFGHGSFGHGSFGHGGGHGGHR